MRNVKAREELVAGRAALRSLLARELECNAQEIEFRVGAHGKPFLECGNLDFNVAHSQRMVLIALSRAGAVGIDIEDAARPVEALDVAQTAFHPDEICLLRNTPEEQRAAVFYDFWTGKEAIAKADGRGLMLPTAGFSVVGAVVDAPQMPEVSLTQRVMNHCVEITRDVSNMDTYHTNSYHLAYLEPGQGFVAALALRQRICSVALYDMHPARDRKSGAVFFGTQLASMV